MLSARFDPFRTSYSAWVAADTAQVWVKPTASSSFDTLLEVNQVPCADGEDSAPLNMDSDDVKVKIDVTAQDRSDPEQADTVYKVDFKKLPSPDPASADLIGLVLADGLLRATPPSSYSY